MKSQNRPQYYRLRRIVEMVREGPACGSGPSSTDFCEELGVSRRTVARDLDYLRDEENAPLAYDAAARSWRLTEPTYVRHRAGGELTWELGSHLIIRHLLAGGSILAM